MNFLKKTSWVILILVALPTVLGVVTLSSIGKLASPQHLPSPLRNGKAQLLAPAQDLYRKDPRIRAALHFLSRRWSTHFDALRVLAVRPGSLLELGIVHSSSLMSARLLIPSANFSKLQQLSAESISHEDDVYLMNEFKPASLQQADIARQLYATETPSVSERKDFAVIVWWNVAESGDGDIRVLTNSGYLVIPVKRGLIIKGLSHVAN